MPAYGGTFAEFSTKVLQFGYLSMFSAAFPLGALASAIANMIELRFDALKLFEVRRPRYMGAEDIGSWQRVLEILSWISLFVNVLMIAYTSYDLRDNIIIPAIADNQECQNVTAIAEIVGDWALDTTSLSAINDVTGTSANISYVSKCRRTIEECFVNVGGVSWLPGDRYLPEESSTTIPFIEALKFGPNKTWNGDEGGFINPLYDLRHHDICNSWMQEVYIARLLFVLILEHCLLFLKLLLAWIIPDKPKWVVQAEARSLFAKETVRKRGSIVVMSSEESEQFENAKAKVIESINDEDVTMQMVYTDNV